MRAIHLNIPLKLNNPEYSHDDSFDATQNGLAWNNIPDIKSGGIEKPKDGPKKSTGSTGSKATEIIINTTTPAKQTPTNTQTKTAEMNSTQASNTPIIAASIVTGMIGSCILANHKKSTATGYVGFLVGGVLIGGVVGFVLSKLLKKNEVVQSALFVSNSSTSNSPAASNTNVITNDQLFSLIDAVVAKNIKNAPVNASNVASVKAAIETNFNDREKNILHDTLVAYSDLPANPTDQQLIDILPKLQTVTDKYGPEFGAVTTKLNGLIKTMRV